MKRKTFTEIFCLIFILLSCFLITGNCRADNENLVQVYFFRGEGCSHCGAEWPFLQELEKQYNENMVIHEYELWYHPENKPLIEKFAEVYGFDFQGVPVTFIGNQYWVGFNDNIQQEIVSAIEKGIESGTPDAMEIAAGVVPLEKPAEEADTVIDIPLIGKVDLKDQSIIISTLLISLVDGVNPCSLWVLSMLLAMVIHTNSRKKAIIIGFVFLTVTSLIYVLFILGVFTVLSYVSYIEAIRIVVAVITFIMGAINLKDYFFYKEGISLTIDDAKKPGIYQKMRNVLKNSDNLWTMIGATVVLAAGVSLVEFSCTAAFPVVWSNLLAAHKVTKKYREESPRF